LILHGLMLRTHAVWRYGFTLRTHGMCLSVSFHDLLPYCRVILMTQYIQSIIWYSWKPIEFVLGASYYFRVVFSIVLLRTYRSQALFAEKKSNFNNPTQPLVAWSITMVNNTPYVTEHAPISVTLPMAHSCLSCWEGSWCSVHSSVELVSSTGVHLTPLCTWTHACQWQCVLWSYIDDLAFDVGLSTIPPWGSRCIQWFHESWRTRWGLNSKCHRQVAAIE